MKICLLSVTLLGLVISSYAKPDGAPQSACSSLMPRHSGIQAQTTQSPYIVSAVKNGNKVEVTISSPGGVQFEGFILQARSNSDALLDGEFTSSEIAKATDCLGGTRNTLTHRSATPKTEVITEWTPKKSASKVTDIIFKATVLQTFSLFWTDIQSLPIQMNLDEPMLSTEHNSKTHSLYDGCFDSKGCFGYPRDCVKIAACEVLLTYMKSPAGVQFNMYGFLKSQSYMAMALSDDDRMGDDSVTECIRDGLAVVARYSYNVGKSNSRTVPLLGENYNSSFNEGLSSCSWTTPYISRMNDHDYNLANNKYYVLLATGPVESGSLRYHDNRLSTLEAVNFTSYEPDGGEYSSETMVQPTSTEFLITSTEKEAKSTNKIPHVASNDTLNGGGSQCSLNLLLLATLGLFYATKGHLYGCFSQV